MRISIVGGGRMGEAIIMGVLNKGICVPEEIVASDTDVEKRAFLDQTYGVNVTSSNNECLSGTDVVILAVKPQILKDVMVELKGKLAHQQLLLSIVAGAQMSVLNEGLSHRAVIRVMPNTPAQIGEGVSMWVASKDVSLEQKDAARSILASLGLEIYVTDEKYLDMATAVSGSGPAYVLLIIESLIDAAVHIGLPRDAAKVLVLQTMLGTARLAQVSDKHPAELKNAVTSPGGTTAEALLKLEEGGLRAIIGQAVVAAYEKSRVLGGEVIK